MGDLATEMPALSGALDGVDTVFHLGALVSPPYLPLARFMAVNRDGTKRLVDACAGRAIRFVHVSTVAVVGSVPVGHRADEQYPCRPVCRYGQSKREAEHVVQRAVLAGLSAVIARPMWTYGPRSRAANRLLQWIARGRFFLVGPAANTIQPIWIEELLDGLERCATVFGIEGRTYHLAGPEILTTEQFCLAAASAMNVKLPAFRLPMAPARALCTLMEKTLVPCGIRPPLDANKVDFFEVNHAYSIALAAKELGWIPKTGWQEGLRKMLEPALTRPV
jgi:nucleoside-diphosphate-sugar epimerase